MAARVIGWGVAAGLAVSFVACGPRPDPWKSSKAAFEEARARTPDYTDAAFDPVLEQLESVPDDHPRKSEALALASVLRSERRVVDRTGLQLSAGPAVEIQVERIQTETTRAKTSTRP